MSHSSHSHVARMEPAEYGKIVARTFPVLRKLHTGYTCIIDLSIIRTAVSAVIKSRFLKAVYSDYLDQKLFNFQVSYASTPSTELTNTVERTSVRFFAVHVGLKSALQDASRYFSIRERLVY